MFSKGKIMRKKAYKIRLIIATAILLMSILGILGLFYPLRFFDINFTPLFERTIVNHSTIAISLLSCFIILTVLFGRFYCSTICPFGIIQELFNLTVRRKNNALSANYSYKYFVAALCFGSLIAGSALFIRYIDPYTIFSRTMTTTVIGIICTILVLVLVFFKNRFFCSNICPVGAILGLISKVSVNKMYMDDKCVQCSACAKNCPVGAISVKEKTIDHETCLKCLKCISICPKSAMRYGVQPTKFNLNRRKALIGAGALALFSAAYAIGLSFAKSAGEKLKKAILPAGAKTPQDIANKCLNCNLCVQNCPNKILRKADSNFPVVHIDYTKGKRFCKYDCHKCSEVCPSGAISKITLKEKQNTRIAMATVNDRCIGCGACISNCPKGAITFREYRVQIDAAKCIGCASCKAVCYNSAIDIYPINEQRTI